jgi:sugar lactone lactonase YvrE
MRIENDQGLADLLAEEQERVLCGGFGFTEGPIWVPGRNYLLVSDIPGNCIYRWAPGDKEATLYRRPSGYANGNTLDLMNRLVTCEHGGRRISVAPLDGEAAAVTDRFEGKRYNSPNDVVVHSSGAIYFTDPTYGIMMAERGFGEPGAVQEQACQGVYRVDPDGSVRRLLDGFTQPNGLAFSPDEQVLYVGDSQDKIINRYDVQPDGSLTGGMLFVDMRGDDRPGAPDGMKVDEDGRLWTTGAGGVWVVEPDGGVLGQFETNEHAANLCFGGSDFSTLYLCTRTTVSAVNTRVRGVAPGSR